MAASGTLIALPAWAEGWRASAIVNDPTSFSAATQETLAAVADTIIPAGNAIGAISVGVDKFLQKLIDDCYEKEVQDNVNMQLEALENAAKNLFGKSFKDCDQLHREGMLLKLFASENSFEVDFFKLIKSEILV